MSIRSMTGFGAARAAIHGWHVKVELKAVNHKGLDVRVSAPRSWSWFEARAIKKIKRRLRRGRVSVNVEVGRDLSEANAGLAIDEDAFGRVVARLQQLSDEYGLGEHQVTLAEVLTYRSLFELSDSDVTIDDEEPFLVVVDQALDAFDASRLDEGETIAADLSGHIEALAALLARVEELRPQLLGDYRERLTARLDELAEVHGVSIEPERVVQEIILFADRSDIAEEIQRAGAHIDRLRQLLAEEQGPHGKKLDFYLQEMIRETNTMASKSNFSELTAVVVEMKSHVEQMREQAANVE